MVNRGANRREFEAGGPEPSWPEELKSSPLAHIPNKGTSSTTSKSKGLIFVADSALEENRFEISVPRQIGSGFEASVGLRPVDSRRGGITRAVVGLGKPIELFRRLKEPPLTLKAPTLLAVARHRGTEISNRFSSSEESCELRYRRWRP